MVLQTPTRKTKMSVTVNPELKAFAEEIAKETNTTPSGIVSQCLEELLLKRKEKLMIECYQDMATEHRKFAQKSDKVVQRIASSWVD